MAFGRSNERATIHIRLTALAIVATSVMLPASQTEKWRAWSDAYSRVVYFTAYSVTQSDCRRGNTSNSLYLMVSHGQMQSYVPVTPPHTFQFYYLHIRTALGSLLFHARGWLHEAKWPQKGHTARCVFCAHPAGPKRLLYYFRTAY